LSLNARTLHRDISSGRSVLKIAGADGFLINIDIALGVAEDEPDLPCSFASARTLHTRSLNLPYWVPDWHSHDKSTSLAPSSKPRTFHT
jgi:hypothetical protein